MKKYLLLCCLFFSLTLVAQGQRNGPKDPMMNQEARKKIEQLEKLKIIDELGLDEETAIKFFSRKKASSEKVKDLELEAQKIEMNLEKSLNEKRSDSEILIMIQNLKQIQTDITNEKYNFLTSVKDILTVDQIGKLIVLDKKFKDEIRRIIQRERKNRFR